MKAPSIARKALLVASVLGPVLFAGCTDLNYPSQPYHGGYNSGGYNNGGGYNGGGYNSGYNDSYSGNDYKHRHHEEHELEHEREKAEDERRRAEEERHRLEAEREALRHQSPPPPPRQELHCPPGTHPSTHRCTSEERRRGCKDYGAGNGQGCSNF